MFYNMFVSMLAEFALLFQTFFRNDPPAEAPRRGAVLLKKALALSMQDARLSEFDRC